jgi:FMN phosphatase YigB (HAD superfamily)
MLWRALIPFRLRAYVARLRSARAPAAASPATGPRRYTTLSPQAFATALETVDLVSFDIFDTIVTRPALAPDSVLRYVGHRIARLHPAVTDFFDRRKAAEAAARAGKRFKGDVDLHEIYAAFAPDGAWSADLIRRAAELERAVDGATLQPRPGMKSLLEAARAAGKRVIAISDTYYTRPDIERILAGAGLLDAIDHLYISSVDQARKDRGDLWDRVRRSETATVQRWLHVGDNERSDMQAADDRGIQVLHAMHPARLLETFGYRPAPDADRQAWAGDLVAGPAMLRLAGRPFPDGQTFGPRRLPTAGDVGFVVFGPLLFHFYAWLVRHPALRPVRHLHFLSREGFLLEQLHARVRQRFPELDLPPGRYFHSSRRVALSAAQAVSFSPDAIMAGIMFNGTLRDLLRHRLGLEFDGDAAVVDWQIALPRDRERLRAALEALRPVIVRHAAQEREKLTAYARQSGMLEPGPQAVVDIGYSATIQKGLQTALAIPLTGFYLATFDAARHVDQGGGQAFGCLAEFIPPFASHHPALRAPILMEAFLTAPHGQVNGFRDEQGRIAPIFKAAPHSAEETPILIRLQDGALDYCLELLDTYGPDLLYADIPDAPPQEFVRMATEGALAFPDEVLAILRVEDEYCGNGNVQVTLG